MKTKNKQIKNQFLLAIFSLVMFTTKAQNMYVYMGENDANRLSVRIDGDGVVYPEINVPMNEGCNVGSSDRSFVSYMMDESCPMRKKIMDKYKLSGNPSIEEIQKAIVDEKIKQINEQLKNQQIDNVTFIMVGFNNHYYIESTEECANNKLALLKTKIDNLLKQHNKKTLVVDVYWDGTESEQNNVYTALHLSNSSVTSSWAGLGLREVINGLDCETINLISHSMGANVITESIFNQTSKFGPAFRNELNRETPKIPIPTKTITAAMIAPAIPGVNTFVDYFKPSNNNNPKCTFIVGYNTNDEMLLKTFSMLPKNPNHFSSTSLGCVKDEVNKVAEMFNANPNLGQFKQVDFSRFNNQPQNQHALEIYMNQPQYEQVLKIMFKI